MSKVVSFRQRHVEKCNGFVASTIGNTLALCKAMATYTIKSWSDGQATEFTYHPTNAQTAIAEARKVSTEPQHEVTTVYRADGSVLAGFVNGKRYR